MRRPSSGGGREAVPAGGELPLIARRAAEGHPWRKTSARHLEPVLELCCFLVAYGDDAVAGPHLARRGRFLVPLLLHADLDRRGCFAQPGQRQAQLVDRLVARRLAAD